MSFVDAVPGPVCVTVAGRVVQFPKLTLRDMGALLAAWIAEDRAEIIERFDSAGAPVSEKLQALSKLHEEAIEKGGPGWACTAVLRPTRRHDTLLRSLRRANPSATDEDVDRLGIDPHDALDVCWSVWGAPSGDNLPLVDPEASSDPKAADPAVTGP